jgi:hypothetical protein
MRIFFFTLFTSVMLTQALQGFVTLVNWKINQTEITEKYCENKANPMLNCNGQCYLSKQLKKQEEVQAFEQHQNNKKIPTPKKSKENELFLDHNFSIVSILKINFITSSFANLEEKYVFDFTFRNFHPPQFI